jgi:hypothetical protein
VVVDKESITVVLEISMVVIGGGGGEEETEGITKIREELDVLER